MKESYLKNVHIAYFLLAIAILIIALFSNWVTLHYFELGIASSDLDKTTSGLAFKSALAMMSASLICFSLSKIITDKSITENLRFLGFGLWIFELAIMSCTQYFIFKRDAAPLEAAEQQEALYSQSIEEHHAIALAGNENSRVQGRSKYTSNRIHASELLKDSQEETKKADAEREKLAASISSKKITFAGVLSPIALLFLSIARSFFLSVISIRFFTLFGSMFRRGLDLQEQANNSGLPDGTDPASKRPSLDKKEEFTKTSEPPSFNQVQPHPNAVLTLVKQEEESDCGIACLAMIMGTDINVAREMWTGDYCKTTGIDLNEYLNFIKSKNIPFASTYDMSQPLENLAGDDNVVLCVVGVNGAGVSGSFDGHSVMFEKGVVYCPSRGYMSEQEAFTRFFKAHSFHVIRCADLPRGAVSPDGAVLASYDEKNKVSLAKEERAPCFQEIPGTPILSKENPPESQQEQEKNTNSAVLFEDTQAGTRGAKKRDHESYDTGTEKGKNLRYKMMVQKIKRGELRPSIRAVKQEGKCDYATAAKYLSGMADKGILERLKDGTYRLVIKRQKLRAV